MDKVIDTISGHSVTINERKNIVITGVKKIENFDNEEFLLETTMGFINIKGSDLEIIKLLVIKKLLIKKKKKKVFLVNYLNDSLKYSN